MAEIHLLKNKKSPLTKLNDPPDPFPNFIGCQSRPIYYFDQDTNYIFIIEQSAIIKYNLDTQTISKRYQYLPTFFNHLHAGIDPTKSTIHLVCRLGRWITFNLKTKKWNHSFFQRRQTVHFKFIPSPINQLHFVMNNKHYIMDKENINKLSGMELSVNVGIEPLPPVQFLCHNEIPHYRYCKSVYNSITNEWMLFQAGTKNILICKIESNEQSKYEWKTSEIKLSYRLPESIRIFEVILYMNQILLIFNFRRNVISIIDLWHIKHRRHLILNENLDFEYVIKDNQDYIHLLQLNRGVTIPSPCHLKIALFNLIPESILNINQKSYGLLIDGFCREFQETQELAYEIVPDLVSLMLQYLTIFR